MANKVWIAIVAVGSLCLSLNAAELPRPSISRQLEMYRHRTNILYNQLETENCSTPEDIVVKRSILSDSVATHLEFEKVFYQKLVNQLIACRKQKIDLPASTTTSKPGSTTTSTLTARTTERTISPTTKLTLTPTAATTTTTTTKLETTTQTSTTSPSPPATDCQALWYRGVRTDGIYTLTPEGFIALDAWCQFDATNGWTVIQKRYDGTVDFYRTWLEYKSGFGELEGEYWLGNEKIFSLTRRNRKLSIYMMRWDGDEATANYSNFYISNESDNYRLTISGYSGNAGYDSMAYHNGSQFSTRDRDNDAWSTHCADSNKGAWWYKSCAYSNLNGPYTNSSTGDDTNMWWAGEWAGGSYRPLGRTTMMITRD